jgi:hypothetical protein
MKRKLSELPESEKEAKRRELDVLKSLSPPDPIPDRILRCVNKQIDYAFDVALSRKSAMDVSVEFPMLQEFAATMLFAPLRAANINYSTRFNTRYSTAHLDTVIEARIQWKVTDMAIAEKIFGDRFQERKYADANGWINFDPEIDSVNGGLICPVVDVDAPFLITYDWDVQHCKLSFRAEKKEATVKNGKLHFNQLRV